MDLGRTKQELENRERLKKKREEELKRTLPRHSDFSSVIDRHKLIVSVEEKQFDATQKLYAQLLEQYDRTLETFVRCLLNALPLQDLAERLLKDVHHATGAHAQEQRLGTLEAQIRAISNAVESRAGGTPAKDEYELLKSETAANKATMAQVIRDIDRVNKEKEETRQLKTENATNKANIAKLLERIDTLTDQVARQAEELQQVRSIVDGQVPRCEALENKVRDHGQTLAEFDADNLSQAADFFAFEKPRLLEDVASARQHITNLSTTLSTMVARQAASPPPAILSAVVAQPQPAKATVEPHVIRMFEEHKEKFVTKMANKYGEMVESLRKMISALEGRIQALEERPLQAAPGGPDGEKLMRDVNLLSSTLQTSIDGVKEELDQKYLTIQTMVTTLDSQFNNVTTKDVYEAIVGHIEPLLPNSEQLRHLQEDVHRLNGLINIVYAQLRDNNGQGSPFQLATTLDGKKRNNELAAAANGGSPPPPQDAAHLTKRRRVDTGPTHTLPRLRKENGQHTS